MLAALLKYIEQKDNLLGLIDMTNRKTSVSATNADHITSNILLYTADTGSVSIQVRYENGTFWLTQKRMAELFGVDVRTINYHLKEIYQSGELQQEATIQKIRIVQKEVPAMWSAKWISII